VKLSLQLRSFSNGGILQFWHVGCADKGIVVRKKMTEVSKLRLIEPKHKFRKKALEKSLEINEPGELVTDLKNAMTLFYLALETLRSSLDKPAVCAKRIEELKSLTSRIHAQMDKLLETIT
jgi:hypothetical protein